MSHQERQERMDGREIATIYWPDTETEEGRHCTAGNGCRLVYSFEFFGDHGLAWVLEMRGDDEVRRYNTRFIEQIDWKWGRDEQSPAKTPPQL